MMDLEWMTQQAISLLQSGQLSAATSVLLSLLEEDPGHLDGLQLLGLAYYEQGDTKSARHYLALALSKAKDHPLMHVHMGNLCAMEGNEEVALKHYREALKFDPQMHQAMLGVGLSLFALGALQEAIFALTASLQQRPADARALHTAFLAYMQLGDFQGLLVFYRRLRGELSLANIEKEAIPSQIILAEALEKAGDLPLSSSILEFLLTQALGSEQNFSVRQLLFLNRILLNEPNRLPLVEEFLEGKKEALTAPQKRILHKNLAMHYDKEGAYDTAFRHYVQQNAATMEEVKQSYGELLPAKRAYDTQIREILARGESGNFPQLATWQVEECNTQEDALTPQHVFLVGFPRSGTTLLDQILHSQEDIFVLEEKPLLHRIAQDMQSRYGVSHYLDGLPFLTKEDVLRYRASYAKDFGERKERILVNKLPLNLIYLPLIAHLFPTAPILLAKRNAMACITSCFFQDFALHTAMLYFLDLQETTFLYETTMKIAKLALEKYANPRLVISYEALVASDEGFCTTTGKLLSFLGINGAHATSRALDFARTAKRRNILTPSYHKVRGKRSSEAIAHWKNYASFLEEALGKGRMQELEAVCL